MSDKQTAAAEGYYEGSSSFEQSHISGTVASESLSNAIRNMVVFWRYGPTRPNQQDDARASNPNRKGEFEHLRMRTVRGR